MKHRKANDDMKSVVDAAALQSDLARRFNLPGAMARKSNRTAGASSSRGTCVVSASSFHRIDISRSPTCCESCNMPSTLGSRICSSCGYFFCSGVRLLESTLAERRGLVTLPSVIRPMVECEWRVVESQLKGAETFATAQSTYLQRHLHFLNGRNDAFCPICMEGFKDGREVLLSCSHMFHRHCLSSFEIFMKSEERSCPVCRAIRYQKKITRLGSNAYEAVCSLIIQRTFRGYLARKEYYNIIKIYYDSGRGGKSRQRTKFYERQLSTYLSRIDDDFQRNKIESDSFLSAVDRNLEESKQLDTQLDLMLRNRSHVSHVSNFRNRINSSHSQTFTMDSMHRSAEDERLWREQNDGEGEGEEVTASASGNETLDLRNNFKRIETRITADQWNDALCKAEIREKGFGRCAICMSENTPYFNFNENSKVSVQRPLLLLSCSHVFHELCVLKFEEFLRSSDRRACPVCRCCDYSKRRVTAGTRFSSGPLPLPYSPSPALFPTLTSLSSPSLFPTPTSLSSPSLPYPPLLPLPS